MLYGRSTGPAPSLQSHLTRAPHTHAWHECVTPPIVPMPPALETAAASSGPAIFMPASMTGCLQPSSFVTAVIFCSKFATASHACNPSFVVAVSPSRPASSIAPACFTKLRSRTQAHATQWHTLALAWSFSAEAASASHRSSSDPLHADRIRLLRYSVSTKWSRHGDPGSRTRVA